MRDDFGQHDLVLGANRLIVDIVRAMLSDGPTGPAVAVLVEPDEEQWRQLDGFLGGIVLVTSAIDDDVVVAAVKRGAHAVLEAAELGHGLPKAVRAVRGGEAVLTPGQVRLVVDALRPNGAAEVALQLSRREAEILRLITTGHSVKQTAEELGITPKTVENLQGRLFRKLQVRTRAQAVARAHELGLLSPEGPGAPQRAEGFSS